MTENKILLLVGSPKTEHSTSNALGQYLLQKFITSECEFQTFYVYQALKDDEKTSQLINSFNDSDLIILTYPLYVDSLPANCIKLMELITKKRSEMKTFKIKKLLIASNCGFYEKEQIQNSVNVCRLFAKENNLDWQGAICVGGGAQIDGKKLEDLGGMSMGLRKAIDKIAASINNNIKPPKDFFDNIVFPPEPKFMYFMIANSSFKKKLAKKQK